MLKRNPLDVVVGASSSIGRHYLDSLLPQGKAVLATHFSDVRPPEMERKGVSWIRCDVTSTTDLDHLIGKILIPGIPVRLVWFPGTLSGDPSRPVEWLELNQIFQINSVSITYLVSNIWENLAPGSRICICSSVAAIRGSYDLVYAASKSALSGLVLSAGNRCNRDNSIFAILPNTIEDSSMFRSFSPDVQDRHRSRSARGLVSMDEVVETINSLMAAPADSTRGILFPIGVD